MGVEGSLVAPTNGVVGGRLSRMILLIKNITEGRPRSCLQFGSTIRSSFRSRLVSYPGRDVVPLKATKHLREYQCPTKLRMGLHPSVIMVFVSLSLLEDTFYVITCSSTEDSSSLLPAARTSPLLLPVSSATNAKSSGADEAPICAPFVSGSCETQATVMQ